RVASGDQVTHSWRSRRLAFPSGDFCGEPLANLLIESSHQSLNAVFTHVRSQTGIARDGRDRTTNPIICQNPIKALARVHALIEGDVNQLLPKVRLRILAGVN